MDINLYAPINSTGYGIASINILKSLIEEGNKISYFPINNPSVNSQEEYDFIINILNHSFDFDPDAPCLKIWHQFDLSTRIGNGKYYAYPFFELDKLNDMEKKHLSVPNSIFVSSDWAKHVLLDNNITQPIHVAPLGVDRKIFDESLYPDIKPNNNKYIFLTIGKWEVRKAHDILPKIFKLAFPTEKNVELWILASEHSSYSNQEQITEWKKLYSDDPRFKIIPGVQTHHDIAKTIASSHCGLYLSRAEGWDLELLETMSMNRPTISTFYSAHTEFCNDKNSYIVDIDDTEAAYDGKAFVGQGNWAKIGQKQISQIIDYMRYVYKNNINQNSAGIETAINFSWQNTANTITRCISEIEE